MSPPTIDDRDLLRSREDIVAAAVGIVLDDDEAITMRSVAGRLGVQASTLYHYVRDKDELLALVVDQVLGPVSDGTGDVTTLIVALTEHLTAVLNATPGAARVFRAAADTTHRAIAARVTATFGPDFPDDRRRDELVTCLTATITGLLVWGTARTDGVAAAGSTDTDVLCRLLRSAVTALLDGFGQAVTPDRRRSERASNVPLGPETARRAERRFSGSFTPVPSGRPAAGG